MAKLSRIQVDKERLWLNKYAKPFGLEAWRYIADVEDEHDVNYRLLSTFREFESFEEEISTKYDKIDMSYPVYDGKFDPDAYKKELRRRSIVNIYAMHKQFCIAQELLKLFGSADALAESNGYKRCPQCGEFFTDHGESSEICQACSDTIEYIRVEPEVGIDTHSYQIYMHPDK